MNTDTPRTDEVAWPETGLVEGDFARQLERELTAVQIWIAKAHYDIDCLKEQRDRLAEAMRKIQKVGLVAVDAFDELDRIDEIVDEALAAVKGGADE
jgi:hypothetical protein